MIPTAETHEQPVDRKSDDEEMNAQSEEMNPQPAQIEGDVTQHDKDEAMDTKENGESLKSSGEGETEAKSKDEENKEGETKSSARKSRKRKAKESIDKRLEVKLHVNNLPDPKDTDFETMVKDFFKKHDVEVDSMVAKPEKFYALVTLANPDDKYTAVTLNREEYAGRILTISLSYSREDYQRRVALFGCKLTAEEIQSATGAIDVFKLCTKNVSFLTFATCEEATKLAEKVVFTIGDENYQVERAKPPESSLPSDGFGQRKYCDEYGKVDYGDRRVYDMYRDMDRSKDRLGYERDIPPRREIPLRAEPYRDDFYRSRSSRDDSFRDRPSRDGHRSGPRDRGYDDKYRDKGKRDPPRKKAKGKERRW